MRNPLVGTVRICLDANCFQPLFEGDVKVDQWSIFDHTQVHVLHARIPRSWQDAEPVHLDLERVGLFGYSPDGSDHSLIGNAAEYRLKRQMRREKISSRRS